MELSAIAKSLGHDIDCPEASIKKFVIDSRQVVDNSCFFAITGEKCDGHSFIEEALNAGAHLAIGTKRGINNQAHNYICVENIHHAMFKIAAYKRKLSKAKVVAVIGNVGKTTTKEYLKSILSDRYFVSATKGNQNGLIGVPLTILNTPAKCEALVLEIGIDQVGDMKALSSLARPDDALVTSLGSEHLLKLKDEATAVAEELLLCEDVLKRGGQCFLPMWNHWAKSFAEDHVKTYGKKLIAIWLDEYKHIWGAKNIHFKYNQEKNYLKLEGKATHYHLPQPGYHNAKNFALASSYTHEKWAILPSVHMEFSTPDGRTQVCNGINGSRLILDYYNAQEDSVLSALELLKEESKRLNKPSICILGDLLDLGEHEKRIHQRVANRISSLSIETVLLCGPRMKSFVFPLLEPLYKRNNLLWFAESKQIEQGLSHLAAEAVILLKGSRAMHMENVVPFLSRKL